MQILCVHVSAVYFTQGPVHVYVSAGYICYVPDATSTILALVSCVEHMINFNFVTLVLLVSYVITDNYFDIFVTKI
jgi:hypothetical protein